MKLILSVLALLVLVAVGARLANLPLPSADWRCRLSHAGWVASHVLIGMGSMGLAATNFRGDIEPSSVAMLLAGMCLMLLGRWRRRSAERSHRGSHQ